jgi:hypothetical protein
MSKPLDKYDLHDRITDAYGCFALAIAEIRKAGVIAGRYQPINDEERSWLNP